MRGDKQSSCALCPSRHKNDARREVPVLLLEAYLVYHIIHQHCLSLCVRPP